VFLKSWRFATVLLASLSLAMSFCHVLEMPARRSWDQSLWVATTVTGGLYRMFGPTGVGAWIDLGAIVAAGVLAYRVRHRRPAFGLTLAGAVGLAAANAAWWALVFPANLELADWLTGPVPADWASWRDRWEFGHATVAGLKAAGFVALVLSVVAETPPGDVREPAVAAAPVT
jgi:hypothetical protein